MSEGTGRVALVTGGSRGIGRAVCLELAAAGHAIAVNYSSRASAAQAVVAEIIDAGGTAVAMQADVSDPDDVARLFESVGAELGPPEILVNNAGVTRDNLMMRLAVEDWDHVLAVNLRSAFLTSKAALRQMVRARWGRVINISSVSGISGNAGQTNYAASKAGLIGLTKSLAKEVGSRGITANVVAPGYIETDMTDALGDDVAGAAAESTAVGRLGSPTEVASAVGYLASERAAYITGQVLVVDGGLAI